MRTEMAAREGNIVYFASPKPGSYSPENQDKPVHGRVKEFSYRKAAFNGVNKQWGLFLHNLVKNKPSNNIIEMGTCSGFSGCYIASANNFSKFVTIEVSSELCEIARGHIKKFSERFVAINKLFDDAIDDFLDEGLSGIDIAYIDGHHEKLATLHYFERIKPMLNPDSVVIFDDIYWSKDMYDAWTILRQMNGVKVSINAGKFGLCIWNVTTQKNNTIMLDFHNYTGYWKIEKGNY